MAKRRADRYIRASLTPRTEKGLERIVFFSDAVIAIAITLLAIEIRLPDEAIAPSELTAALLSLIPRYLSFFISFFVIGLFWMSHHRMFEYIHTYNQGLIWINLIFLFLVAFIPFPTALIGRFPAEFSSVVFYAAVLVCLSLVRVWLWWYVYYRAHLIRPNTNPRAGRYELTRALLTAGVFGISILIAFWNPGWAMNFWILLLPIAILTRPPS
ncbi:MAG: TMEM175 family protein [Anaerolineales bacterium]|jgi:uncharacterized membrane protein